MTSVTASPVASDTAPAAAPRRVGPLWRNVNFTLMWTSTAATGFGDRMIQLAALALLGGAVAGADATSIQASVSFWFFLAYIVFSVPAGWLADHLPRKWLLLGCDESRFGLLLLSFFLLAAAGGAAALPAPYHWRVWAILFAVGLFASIFNPTRNAIIPQIIPRPQLQAANAIILGITVVASMIGMVAGGQIIDPTQASSVRTGLFVGAMFYLVSGGFFAFLKPHEQIAPGGAARRRSLWQAAAYLRVHRRLLLLIAFNVLIWAAAATVYSAVLGLAKAHFGLTGNALIVHFTLVSATLGGGMLLGAIVVSIIGTRRESLIVVGFALAAAGLSVLLLTLLPFLAATFVFAFGVGFFGNIAIVALITMLQSLSPNYMRGRVMGLNALTSNLCSVLTYLAIWQLPDADRQIIPVLWGLGPLLMIVGGVVLWHFLRSGPHRHPIANTAWRLTRLFSLSYHHLDWRGRENIPAEGPVILASNHTTGLDPMLIQATCPRTVRWLMLTSYRFGLLEPLWRAIEPVTLDEHGKGSDLGKLRKVIQVLKGGGIVGFFPEGGLQREHRRLNSFQPGLGMIARRGKATIVPIWVEGTPQRRNMLWHFFEPSHSRVTFGKPYKPAADASDEQIIAELRQRMTALASEESADSEAS